MADYTMTQTYIKIMHANDGINIAKAFDVEDDYTFVESLLGPNHNDEKTAVELTDLFDRIETTFINDAYLSDDTPHHASAAHIVHHNEQGYSIVYVPCLTRGIVPTESEYADQNSAFYEDAKQYASKIMELFNTIKKQSKQQFELYVSYDAQTEYRSFNRRTPHPLP